VTEARTSTNAATRASHIHMRVLPLFMRVMMPQLWAHVQRRTVGF
jgi:hypothetical protein